MLGYKDPIPLPQYEASLKGLPASELPLGLVEAPLSASSHVQRHPLLRTTSFARVHVLIQGSLEIHM